MKNHDDAIDCESPKKQALQETIKAIAKRMAESREQKKTEKDTDSNPSHV